jgi:hypothetical protein
MRARLEKLLREPLVRHAAAVAVATAALSASSNEGSSCGYHSPVDLQRGMLNWTYPDALHVSTAVWQGRRAGILPQRAANPDLFGYHKAVAILQHWRTALQDAAAKDPPPAFSVVFIDTMLWSRFAPVDDALEVRIHQNGPQPEDLVVISDEAVIAAVLSGQVQTKDALASGLIRIYGDPDATARWVRTMSAGGRS